MLRHVVVASFGGPSQKGGIYRWPRFVERHYNGAVTDFTVTAHATIDAAPELVYGILADYVNHHPAILPRPPFMWLEVESGGMGAGTVFTVDLIVMGRERSLQGVVSEPEPGRRLLETYEDPAAGTTEFVVEPEKGRCVVTITTHGCTAREGLSGRAEAFVTTRYLTRVYTKELRRLKERAECG